MRLSLVAILLLPVLSLGVSASPRTHRQQRQQARAGSASAGDRSLPRAAHPRAGGRGVLREEGTQQPLEMSWQRTESTEFADVHGGVSHQSSPDRHHQQGKGSDDEGRRKYPPCGAARTGRRRTGYAHYAGWKLLGDDLSGGVPVHPELSCVMACNKYGGSCSGIYYDAPARHCFLKGTHTAAWTYQRSDETDAVDLIGGCEMWSGVVSDEMDDICCRN